MVFSRSAVSPDAGADLDNRAPRRRGDRSAGIIIEFTVKFVKTSRAMGHTPLAFLERHHVGHLGDLLMEVAHIDGLTIDNLGQLSELQGGELARKQVKDGSLVDIDLTPESFESLVYYDIMVKSQSAERVDRVPEGVLAVDHSHHGGIEFHHSQVADSDDALHMGLLGPLKPDHVAQITCAILGAEGFELLQSHVSDSRQLSEHSLSRLVKILILIDQTARELEVVVLFASMLSDTFDKQNSEA